VTALPPPPPAVWAPRFRAWLNRRFTALDRRKVRILASHGQNVVDFHWRRQYAAWWNEHGWQTGAPTADEAYTNLIESRRVKR